VLLLGEFGTAVTNPPVEVRVVGDLFTIDTLPEESAYSEIINLNGITTTNIIPLADGPSLFFAQRIDGNLNECNSGTQTIQVAWDGGITPYVSGDTESDLFQYYIGYSDSSGVLTPHVPISIADIDDTDNFHQLCFSTSDEIVKISMKANTVKTQTTIQIYTAKFMLFPALPIELQSRLRILVENLKLCYKLRAVPFPIKNWSKLHKDRFWNLELRLILPLLSMSCNLNRENGAQHSKSSKLFSIMDAVLSTNSEPLYEAYLNKVCIS
jgi:hypothetical protein